MNLFIDPWTPKTPGPFRVGDRVRVPFGQTSVEAIIVEDHGNLGAGGKRVYGVRFRVDDVSDEIYTERDADQLTLVAHALAPETEKKNGVPE
jgi:primosomal protein N'